MTGYEPRMRLADSTEPFLDERDEFFDQRSPPRPVVIRVRKHVVSEAAARIQHHVKRLDTRQIAPFRVCGSQHGMVRPAESWNSVDHWESPVGMLSASWQNYTRPHVNG